MTPLEELNEQREQSQVHLGSAESREKYNKKGAMQTTTKICKYQVTTTLKMSIGYLQVFIPIFRAFYCRM